MEEPSIIKWVNIHAPTDQTVVAAMAALACVIEVMASDEQLRQLAPLLRAQDRQDDGARWVYDKLSGACEIMLRRRAAEAPAPDLAAEVRALREELATMRADLNASGKVWR